MGVAAYQRGSQVISMQIHAERCSGCCECQGYKSTPRPPDWGSKTRAKARAKADGLLRFLAARGRPAPSVGDLADMIQADTRWGRATCRGAAEQALRAGAPKNSDNGDIDCQCERPNCPRPPEVRGLNRTCYVRLRARGVLDQYAEPAGTSPGRPRKGRSSQVRISEDLVQALRPEPGEGVLADLVDSALREHLGLSETGQ